MSALLNRHPQEKKSAAACAVLSGACWYLVVNETFGPVVSGGVKGGAVPLNTAPLIAGYVGFWTACEAVSAAFLVAANRFEIWAAKTPREGKGGTSKWASWYSFRKDRFDARSGKPYWGVFARGRINRGKPIFADYASNAVTFGTAGAGKGVGVVLPTCLAIRASKLIPDFKGTNSCMLFAALKKRGEEFRVLNIGDQHTDILGVSDFYNPLNTIADTLVYPGGLKDLPEDSTEISCQLYPEGSIGNGETYWRDGSCDIIAVATIQCILVHGFNANLGHVNLLLNNRVQLKNEMLWAAGQLVGESGTPLPAMPIQDSPWVQHHDSDDVDTFIEWYRAKAGGLAFMLQSPDNKTLDSFLTGAQQALAPFAPTSRAAEILSHSSFRFADMKRDSNKPMTVSIVMDASRMENQSKICALLQHCAMKEWKRAQNTTPVYIIGDETTNFKIDKLPELLTYGREYGIRWHGFIQSIAAFRKTYGKDAVSTLLSETEVKQFLPGTREPEMLELIEKQLGRASTVNENRSGKRGDGANGYSFSADTTALMTADQIRRTKHAILFIRNNRPILTDLPPIAAIAPWRKQIGVNPFYGKRWLKPVTLRIYGPLRWRAVKLFILGGRA